MKPHRIPLLLFLLTALWLGGCATVQPSAPPPATAGSATPSISDRLYCGRTIPKGGEVTDDGWAQFLADFVTPRFPEGLTVLHGEGQWRDDAGKIWRERSFVLELNHPDTAAAEQRVREIITEYKRRFSQDAVFRMRTHVDTSVL
jgi:hypothetical protein